MATPVSPVGREEIPRPIALIGSLLALAFVGLTFQAYFGFSPLAKLKSVLPTPMAEEPWTGNSSATILYARGAKIPSLGTQILDNTGSPFQLASDMVVLDGAGELVRLNSDGTATKLIGRDGQRVHVSGLGPWDTSSKQLAGLDAVAKGARWLVETTAMNPANPNALLQQHEAAGS